MEDLFLKTEARKLFNGRSCPLWSSSYTTTTGIVASSCRLSVWTSGPHLLYSSSSQCHWVRPSHFSPQHLLLGPARPPQNLSRTGTIQVLLLCAIVSCATVTTLSPTSLNFFALPISFYFKLAFSFTRQVFHLSCRTIHIHSCICHFGKKCSLRPSVLLLCPHL